MTQAILLDERAAAAALGVTPRALQEWRRRGEGPQYVRISRRCIRYRPEDLKDWAADRLRTTPENAHVA
jgi:predicted DNA-binding transcriptional regulator AlpA